MQYNATLPGAVVAPVGGTEVDLPGTGGAVLAIVPPIKVNEIVTV